MTSVLRKLSNSTKTYQIEKCTKWVSGYISDPCVLRAEIARSPRQPDSNQRRFLLGTYSGTRRAVA
eukprot:4815974-Pleurochrysis_carterae.AAC.1